MTVQAILSVDGKVFAAEDFSTEASARKWAEEHKQMDHYLVTLFMDADDDPYAEYIVSSRFGMHK